MVPVAAAADFAVDVGDSSDYVAVGDESQSVGPDYYGAEEEMAGSVGVGAGVVAAVAAVNGDDDDDVPIGFQEL